MSIEDVIKQRRLFAKLRRLNFLYSAGDSGVSDAEFDKMMDQARLYDPDHPLFQFVGSEYGTEIPLPVPVGSLEKVRPDEAVEWFEKILPKSGALRNSMIDTPLIVTPKLDGASILLEYSRDGVFTRAYSRGDGIKGQDVTHAVRFCEKFPRDIYTFSCRMFVRAEIILRRSEFVRLRDMTFDDKPYPYVNARNAIVGCLNAKQKSPFHTATLRAADMIALGVYFIPDANQEMPRLPYYDPRATERADVAQKSLQYSFLKNKGFSLPYSGLPSGSAGLASYNTNASKVWPDAMRATIHNLREKYDYETDGLVIEVDVPKAAQSIGNETNSIKPRWARAVKLDPSEQEARVIEVADINWQRTARGIYKPIVVLGYDAIFQGVRVRNVYVDNARWVKKHRVGPGAFVAVIRSGDVIPRIIQVTKKSPFKAKLPKRCIKHKERLVWTETMTDLYCPVCAGELNSPPEFFKQLAPDNIGETLVAHVCEHLKLETIQQVLQIRPVQLTSIEKFGNKRALDFHASIHRAVEQASLAKLMHCSGAFRSPSFGLGETRLQSIIDALTPEYLMGRDHSPEELYHRTKVIDGIGSRGARCFADQLGYFKELFESIEGFCYAANEEASGVKVAGGVLNNMKFAFTGFRNKDLEVLIKREGGRIAGSVSKGVDTVFAADTSTVKAKRATQLGIPVVHSSDAEKFLTNVVRKKRKKAGLPLDQVSTSSNRKRKSMDRKK